MFTLSPATAFFVSMLVIRRSKSIRSLFPKLLIQARRAVHVLVTIPKGGVLQVIPRPERQEPQGDQAGMQQPIRPSLELRVQRPEETPRKDHMAFLKGTVRHGI